MLLVKKKELDGWKIFLQDADYECNDERLMSVERFTLLCEENNVIC